MKITESSLRQLIRTILLSEVSDENKGPIERALKREEEKEKKEDENKKKINDKLASLDKNKEEENKEEEN